jgi:beta-glucosidase
MIRHAPILIACAVLATATQGAAAQSARPGEANPALWPRSQSAGLVDPATEAFVSRLLARMSLEEKVGQMIQGDISTVTPDDLRRIPLGSVLAGGNSSPHGAADRAPPQAWQATARAYRAVSLEERAGHVPVPVIFGIDAVHGHNNVVGATIFPHNIALGAMRDPVLVRRIGEATAREIAATGIDWAFAPTLAVPRDARWGRTYEGYAESPDLVRTYASAFVLGLQGEPGAGRVVQRGHVAATPKHFLGDGGTTGGVDQGNAEVSEDDLIRIHAAGYPAAIEAGAMSVMVSFSSWQGAKMTGNASLLTGVLKQRMGFAGIVVSDWNAHSQLPGCTAADCPGAVIAGIDLLMAPEDWKALYASTLAHARAGRIPAARIDDAVRRILRVKVRLGLFEPARPWEGRTGVIGAPAHRALAREAVRKSLVLLKNDGVLPIRANARVLVAGPGADDIGRQCGGWTLSWQGDGNTNADFPNGESIYAGLRAALAAGGGRADLDIEGRYAQKPDVAVVVFGEEPYAEMRGDLRSLDYGIHRPRDLALLKRLREAGIPVVSVFLSGRPLRVNPEINESNAFVAAWLPGSEGAGVADLLIGDAQGRARHDFSGRLAYSWPGGPMQSPLFAYGYGLNYARRGDVPRLPEAMETAVPDRSGFFAAGQPRTPWTIDVEGVETRAVDVAGLQEGGRQFNWPAGRGGSVALVGQTPVDLSDALGNGQFLELTLRIDVAPAGRVGLGMECGAGCGGLLDFTAALRQAPPGAWQVFRLPLAGFRDAGADLRRVTAPFLLHSTDTLRLTLAGARLASGPGALTDLQRLER